jgi:two-component system OmpR family sensor kinase
VTQDLDGSLVVRGDRLRQVLDNLLANVRTHTPQGTPVRVTVAREGDTVAVAVADEGPGIAEEERERIFERFWRGGSPRLRSHGGTIDVESEPGKGTTFTIRLPLAGVG